jgi:cell filamentation protein
MPYDITDDPYIDPKTGILRNKIKAKTQSALDRAEADITYIAIFTLSTGSRVGSLKFDAALLKDVNKSFNKPENLTERILNVIFKMV